MSNAKTNQGKNAVVGKSLRRVNAAMSKSVVLTGEWSAAEGCIAFRRVNAAAMGKHVLLTRGWSAAKGGAFRRITAAMGNSVLLEIPVNNLDPEFNFFWQWLR